MDVAHTSLYKRIDVAFDQAEVRLLCFDLGIDYDNIPGDVKIVKCLNLEKYARQHQRMDDLVATLRKQRPNLDWSYKKFDVHVYRRSLSKSLLLVVTLAITSIVLVASTITISNQRTPVLSANSPQTVKPTSLMRMSGTFNIAIANFDDPKATQISSVDIGNFLRKQLEQEIKSSDFAANVEIWGPERVGRISGATSREQAKSAELAIQRLNAHILIYGITTSSNSVITIEPRFYVAGIHFAQVPELIGSNALGTPIEIYGGGTDPSEIILANKKLVARVSALSKITLGLSAFGYGRYESALQLFKEATLTPNWGIDPQESEGKEVAYHFWGNAALFLGQLPTATQAFSESIRLAPNYARSYISLGQIRRIEALNSSKNLSADTVTSGIDFDKLDQAIALFEQASQYKESLPEWEIKAKADFGLGECYMLLAWAKRLSDFAPAIDQFNYIIAAYQDGNNPRLRYIAAEAHARLGLIYQLVGDSQKVRAEYHKALDICSKSEGYPCNPTRVKEFQTHIDGISK